LKKFLSSGTNKQALIRFIGDHILGFYTSNAVLEDGQSLVLAGVFSNPDVKKVETAFDCVGLNSSQEEADTRIILHALNMNNQFKDKNVMGRIVIKSLDTDVLVLLVHYFSRMSNISELWFQTGTITTLKDGRRYIPVHDLCKSLSAVQCRILPAAHALTGCDTTSAMFGIGKKLVYKLLKESPDEFKDLCKLGDSDVETAVDASRKLVSNLYDQRGKSKKMSQ
jgi:hypothetical protein